MIKVIKRNGELEEFNGDKIKNAMVAASLATHGLNTTMHNKFLCDLDLIFLDILSEIELEGNEVSIEDIQDLIESNLMSNHYHNVAKSFILYREDQRKKRESLDIQTLKYSDDLFDKLVMSILEKSTKNTYDIDVSKFYEIANKSLRSLPNNFTGFDKVSNFIDLMIISTRVLITTEPQWSNVCANLLNIKTELEVQSVLEKESNNLHISTVNKGSNYYGDLFLKGLEYGVSVNRIDKNVVEAHAEHLKLLSNAVNNFSIMNVSYSLLSVQTLYDRYLLHENNKRYETIPSMFMRIAMGLAQFEKSEMRLYKTLEFYDAMTTFSFMPSTPTLFNSGTIRPQLSSCYLTTIPDDLLGIYQGITDDALLSKYAGGLGNDWTNVRGLGSYIAGTNGKSQGVVPFMKVANDTAVAVNQGGKRKGAICAYLETWHIDIEDFLDLRKNTGDDRRRTHDMHTANWIPDLFMKRVKSDSTWTLFSPDEVPDLHDLYGTEFEERYKYYESKIDSGEIKLFKKISAVTLWRKMLTMLYETGHPWLLFKDAFNVRYTNQHVGIIHSSNLCFTGDTMIATADGRNAVSIKQLAEESQRVNMIDVYSARRKVGPKSGWKTEIKPAIAFNTGVKEVIKVTLSDGSRFKCTPDHKLFTPSGDVIEAQHAIGTTIESFFTYTNVDKNSKYRHINSISNGHAKQHIMIYEHANGDRPRGYHVDHLCDGSGDALNNLQLLSADAHYAKTGSLRFAGDNPIHKADKAYIKAARKAQVDGVGNPTFCGIDNYQLFELAIKFKKDNGIDEFKPKHYNLMREHYDTLNLPKSFSKYRFGGSFKLFCDYVNLGEFNDDFEYSKSPKRSDYYDSFNNDVSRKAYINNTLKNGLTVVSIETVEPEDVYCLTVDVNHNFYIITQTDDAEYLNCSGILVKNCTEIGLHTNKDEIAVCNLGSINLTNMFTPEGILNTQKLKTTVYTAIRMLDNVIDYNFYPVEKAERSNKLHRPIGLGVLGFQDVLYMKGIPYDSQNAVDLADEIQEVISFYAIEASMKLAKERGTYKTFEGSLWSKGIFPLDSLKIYEKSRGIFSDHGGQIISPDTWEKLKERVKKHGMRNSNVMAIAPTATISNICGVSQSIEPTYQNIYVKSNLSGEFVSINPYLVTDLKKIGLWSDTMAYRIVNADGSIQSFEDIPKSIRDIYKTAFEIDTRYIIKAGARRQKWIDQAQSLNLYVNNPTGKFLDEIYKLAFDLSLKSTYYLRSLGATNSEKTNEIESNQYVTEETKFCSIDNIDCESCQ